MFLDDVEERGVLVLAPRHASDLRVGVPLVLMLSSCCLLGSVRLRNCERELFDEADDDGAGQEKTCRARSGSAWRYCGTLKGLKLTVTVQMQSRPPPARNSFTRPFAGINILCFSFCMAKTSTGKSTTVCSVTRPSATAGSITQQARGAIACIVVRPDRPCLESYYAHDLNKDTVCVHSIPKSSLRSQDAASCSSCPVEPVQAERTVSRLDHADIQVYQLLKEVCAPDYQDVSSRARHGEACLEERGTCLDAPHRERVVGALLGVV